MYVSCIGGVSSICRMYRYTYCSPLTYVEDAHVQQLVSKGQKPREIMEATQLALVKAGAPKLPSGGVAGACGISMYWYCICMYCICIGMYRICTDMYGTCIDVYRVCIGMYRSRIGMYRQHRLRHASLCTTGDRVQVVVAQVQRTSCQFTSGQPSSLERQGPVRRSRTSSSCGSGQMSTPCPLTWRT